MKAILIITKLQKDFGFAPDVLGIPLVPTNAIKLRIRTVIASWRSNLKYAFEVELNNRLLQFFAVTNLSLMALQFSLPGARGLFNEDLKIFFINQEMNIS